MTKVTSALIATIVIAAFFVISNAILVNTVAHPDFAVAIGIPIIFGALSAAGFLYVFCHEKLFPFATVIEKRQEKAEKRWFRYMPHTGKVASVFLVGAAGGPLVGALAANFLIPKFRQKYYVVLVSGALSGLLIALAARGLATAIFAYIMHFFS